MRQQITPKKHEGSSLGRAPAAGLCSWQWGSGAHDQECRPQGANEGMEWARMVKHSADLLYSCCCFGNVQINLRTQIAKVTDTLEITAAGGDSASLLVCYPSRLAERLSRLRVSVAQGPYQLATDSRSWTCTTTSSSCSSCHPSACLLLQFWSPLAHQHPRAQPRVISMERPHLAKRLPNCKQRVQQLPSSAWFLPCSLLAHQHTRAQRRLTSIDGPTSLILAPRAAVFQPQGSSS